MHSARSHGGSITPSVVGKVQDDDEQHERDDDLAPEEEEELEALVPKEDLSTLPAAVPSLGEGGPFPPRYRVVCVAFLATLILYLDRSGFPLVYTRIARGLHVGEATKGAVMSAFYYGFAALQIPGGILATKYGGRRMLAISFFGWGSLTLLVPEFWESITPVIILRASVGALQGVCMPAFHAVLASWVPPHERSMAFTLTISGQYLGSAIAVTFLPGHTRFYKVVGFFALVWFCAWLSIRTDPRSSERVALSPKDGSSGSARMGLLLSSTAVWAIIINNFTFHYTLYMVLNWLPTYFEKYIKVEMTDLGNKEVIPFLLMFAFTNASGFVGDWFLRRDLRVAVARKVINTAGFTIACMAQLGLCMATDEAEATLAIAGLLSGLGFSRGGFSVNHVDIAPEHAGLLIGISNFAGTVAGIVGVSSTGAILDSCGGAENLNGWLLSMLVACLLNLAGATFFVSYARGTAIFGV